MSERETWLPWSDTLGRYIGYAQQTPAMCDETCGNRNEFEFEGSTDWRTQRIPPPAEIEANARDAAKCKSLVEKTRKFRFLIDNIVDTKEEVHAFHHLVSLVCDLEVVLKVEGPGSDYSHQLDAVLKGGE